MKFKMTENIRELMHDCIDGESRLVGIMHIMTNFVYVEKILKWLVIHNIRGKNLIDWIDKQHSGSVMGMVQFIIMKVNREKKEAPVIYGKDWFK